MLFQLELKIVLVGHQIHYQAPLSPLPQTPPEYGESSRWLSRRQDFDRVSNSCSP